MNKNISIYIADDHQLIIDGLTLLLRSDSNYHVVGSAINGLNAQTDLLALKPTIALLDYRMPGIDGIQLIKNLKRQIETRFILLTMHADHQILKQAIYLGAHAFLVKNVDRVELFNTINQVALGKKVFPETYSNTEIRLTGREIEMLKLIIKEKSISEIALILNLSEHTVKTHRKNIFRKLDTNKVSDMIRFAQDNLIVLD